MSKLSYRADRRGPVATPYDSGVTLLRYAPPTG